MKIKHLMIVLLLCSAVLAESPLVCEAPLKDFGLIEERQKVSHVFVVKNISGKTVDVDRVIPSCGCMVSSKNKFSLGPDESTDIGIEFDSMGLGGLTVFKTISIHINSGEYPPLVLTIKADIKGIPPERRITVSPGEKIINGDPAKRYILNLQVPSDPNVKFSIDTPQWLDYSLQKSKDDDFAGLVNWDIIVFLKSSETKKLNGDLIITSNIPSFEKVTVPIRVIPEPMLTITPYLISFDSKAGQIRDVVIRPNKNAKALLTKNLEFRPSQKCLKTSWTIDNNEIHLNVSNESCGTRAGRIKILADNELIGTIPVIFK